MSTYPQVFKDSKGRDVKVQKSPDEYVLFHYWGESDRIKLILTQTPYNVKVSIYAEDGYIGSLDNNVFNLFSSSDSFYIKRNKVKFTTTKEVMNKWRLKLSKN